MKQPTSGSRYFTLVTVLGAIFTFLLLLVILVFSIQFALPVGGSRNVIPARITVIPPVYSTPVAPSITPGGATITPTPVQVGLMGIGAFIEISGTGGDGLRLRTGPGREKEPAFLGAEDEVFKVVDGPQQADGFTWWFLVAPYDETRKGWAVENYLSVVTSLTPTPKSN